MALRPIVLYPDPMLLRPTAPVVEVNEEIRLLVRDMVETMHAEPGVGLAANQVGVPLRLMVVDLSVGEDPEQIRVLVNPEIVANEGSQVGDEGCLSFPGIVELIDRPMRVTFRANDLEGRPIEETAEGFYARAICHEIDHLDGVVFLSRMSSLKRSLVRRKIRKLQEEGEWSAAI